MGGKKHRSWEFAYESIAWGLDDRAYSIRLAQDKPIYS